MIPRLTESEELALLDHAVEQHGMVPMICPGCAGVGCARCDGHGTVFRGLNPTCSDPCCVLSARMAAIAAKERS